jgi:hypothetical protein
MTNTAGLNRRTLLYAFGIASVSSMLPAQAVATGKVVVTKPGESRFAFTTEQQAWLTPCKLTGEDSGALSPPSNSTSALNRVLLGRASPPRSASNRRAACF